MNLLSSESNDISTREKKNTIHPEHVLRALNELGFEEFVPEVKDAWDSWKRESRQKSSTHSSSQFDVFAISLLATSRPKGHKTAAEAAGFTEEQQIALQQQLFADARARSSSFNEHHSFASDNPTRESHPSTDNPSSVSGTSPFITQNTSLFSELSARKDILPIHPLPVPPISSDFQPNVILSNLGRFELPSVSSSPPPQTTVSEFPVLDLSQPVILLQDGVQHPVSLQMLLSHVEALQQQLNQVQQQQQQVVQIPDSIPQVDCSMQVPVIGSQIPALQPSFPDSIQTSSPQTLDLTNEMDSQNGGD